MAGIMRRLSKEDITQDFINDNPDIDKDFNDDTTTDDSQSLVSEAVEYLNSYESYRDILLKGIKDNLSLTLAIECIKVFDTQATKVLKIKEDIISAESIHGSEYEKVNTLLSKIQDRIDEIKLRQMKV